MAAFAGADGTRLAYHRAGDGDVQPGSGHYPWLDGPRWFVQTLAEFPH